MVVSRLVLKFNGPRMFFLGLLITSKSHSHAFTHRCPPTRTFRIPSKKFTSSSDENQPREVPPTRHSEFRPEKEMPVTPGLRDHLSPNNHRGTPASLAPVVARELSMAVVIIPPNHLAPILSFVGPDTSRFKGGGIVSANDKAVSNRALQPPNDPSSHLNGLKAIISIAKLRYTDDHVRPVIDSCASGGYSRHEECPATKNLCEHRRQNRRSPLQAPARAQCRSLARIRSLDRDIAIPHHLPHFKHPSTLDT